MGYGIGWNIIEQSLYKRAHDHTSRMYIEYSVIEKKILSISFDYRKEVEDDTRDQIPKYAINALEEVPEETKVEDEDNKKVVI